MRTRLFAHQNIKSLLSVAGSLLIATSAQAAEYWLRAAPTAVDMPNPAGGVPIQVAMWGYASCTSNFSECGTPSVPGPAMMVPEGDATLVVHLQNGLTVPTSLVVNGLYKPMAAVWGDGTTGSRPNATARVRSFDAEAAPGGQASYEWKNVKPGTYLYQSGTHIQVQVQMGLYGALTKNSVDPVPANATQPAVRGQAYDGGAHAFDNEATLLYSEIDTVLHEAVANGTYGSSSGPTSTINYAPKYFLINGRPYPTGAPIVEPVGSPGVSLVRLLNAGLTTHVPMIVGRYWDAIAEDGKPYPYRRNQYTAFLPAGKTMDVLLTPEIGATYPIMDRRLNLTNAGLPNGGMMAYLRFGSLSTMIANSNSGGTARPVANADSYDAVVGTTLNIPAPGVLGNDTDAGILPLYAVSSHGTTTGNGSFQVNFNGSFTYTPAPGFVGPNDTFTYMVTDGRGVSTPATVTINAITPIAPALQVIDTFDRADTLNSQAGLGVSWRQVAATGVPPDLRISGNTALAAGVTLGGQAIWDQDFQPNQYAAFTAEGSMENLALILKATGGTSPASPANLVRVRYEAPGVIVVSTLMGGSGAEVYVKQATFPVGAADNGTLSASIDAKGLVAVFLNSNFVGGVQLPDVGAWKGGGRIGLQLRSLNGTVDNFAGGSF